MTETADGGLPAQLALAARLALIEKSPLEERASAFAELYTEMQITLEGRDSAPAGDLASSTADQPGSGRADQPGSGLADQPGSGGAGQPGSGLAGRPGKGEPSVTNE